MFCKQGRSSLPQITISRLSVATFSKENVLIASKAQQDSPVKDTETEG
jgi:hypothetical protein